MNIIAIKINILENNWYVTDITDPASMRFCFEFITQHNPYQVCTLMNCKTSKGDTVFFGENFATWTQFRMFSSIEIAKTYVKAIGGTITVSNGLKETDSTIVSQRIDGTGLIPYNTDQPQNCDYPK